MSKQDILSILEKDLAKYQPKTYGTHGQQFFEPEEYVEIQEARSEYRAYKAGATNNGYNPSPTGHKMNRKKSITHSHTPIAVSPEANYANRYFKDENNHYHVTFDTLAIIAENNGKEYKQFIDVYEVAKADGRKKTDTGLEVIKKYRINQDEMTNLMKGNELEHKKSAPMVFDTIKAFDDNGTLDEIVF